MSPAPPDSGRGTSATFPFVDSQTPESGQKSTPTSPDVSVIIPAYNEEKRLPPTLARIEEYFAARPLTWEILVVDDGSRDQTAQVVESLRSRIAGLRLVSNAGNRGKGYSVRHGMREAKGNVALFTDADLSAPIEEADKLLAALENSDVAIGSRALNRGLIEVHQSGVREMAGKSFNWAVRALIGVPFADTQCGFKAFRRERTQILFEQQRIERFGFDPELLFLARRHGLSVVEVPVRWAHDPATRVHVLGDGLQMVGDLAVIRWNSLLGRYPSVSAAPGPAEAPAGSGK
ncbi:MAG: dolichyl-phosphate beta-glucosyltransferase [Candidatus Acidiferrales bacterium]